MATRAKKVADPAGRLDAKAWTVAALVLLAEQGIDGVCIEFLAWCLGVTKGSFYWHFKDRDELHAAMLDYWRSRTTLGLIDRFDNTDGTLIERLLQLVKIVFKPNAQSGADIELSVRLWGRRDLRAQAALAEVDELRTRYIARQLMEHGMAAEEAKARSMLVYSYMRVAPTLVPLVDQKTLDLCESLLVGKRSVSPQK